MSPLATVSTRPLRPFAVRIHKPDARHCGEPVVIISTSPKGPGYYYVASLSNVYVRKVVHSSCLLRTKDSVNAARRINRRIRNSRTLTVLSRDGDGNVYLQSET